MQKILFTLSLVLLFVSCGKDNKFTIEGNIKNASGSVLYLEHVDLSKASIIDSVKLKSDGDFKFKKERSAFPEFYRLKLGKQSIDLAIDSIETIVIEADSATFAQDYMVEGSENNLKIKELSLLRANTANALSEETLDAYKEIAQKYIIENPGSTVAYYALLQTINGLMIFNPYDKTDNRLYGAVATQWDLLYPDCPLSMYLKNLSLSGLKTIRAKQPLEYAAKTVDFIEIELPTVFGPKIKLSEVITQEKVTLLEFCTLLAQGSPEHNMLLAKVYEKFKDKGFQIFQISLDTDEHAWKNAAVNLPWISVRDPQSVYSENVNWYNVETLPTGFIMDENGEIVSRITDYKNLETDIAKHLK